jgi:hypothetical protein
VTMFRMETVHWQRLLVELVNARSATESVRWGAGGLPPGRPAGLPRICAPSIAFVRPNRRPL